MSVEHHDLFHEFPHLKARIHELELRGEHFRRLFDEYRASTRQIEKTESALRKDASQPHSVDSTEQALEGENDEVLDAVGDESVSSIRLTQAALGRIENGSYRSCDACGSYIGEARLRAVPEAAFCLGCAH